MRLNDTTTTPPCTILRGTTSTSPSSVVSLALDSDSFEEGQPTQEGEVATNMLQQPASPQSLPAAAVKGAQAVDKQINLHEGGLPLPASKLPQTCIEGDGTENSHRTAGAGSKMEAQQPQTKCGNVARLPDYDLDSLGGGWNEKGVEGVGGKIFPSSEREVSVKGVDSATVKGLVDDPCLTARIQTPNILECRALPEAFGSDGDEKHDAPKDKCTPDSQLEVVDMLRKPRHVPPLDESIAQSEPRKRVRETVEKKSERECDREREKFKEESGRFTARNGKRRRQQSLAGRKVGGSNCRVGTRRGRTIASMRELGGAMKLEGELTVDERSTATWYRTIVACLTAESRE